MHAWLGALVVVLLAVGVASATDEKKAHPAQGQRMIDCNARAGERHLTGDARKQFMADCLKGRDPHGGGASTEGKTAPHEKATHGEKIGQGEKMKVCNQEAAVKGLKGDDRKEFMSHCLKANKGS